MDDQSNAERLPAPQSLSHRPQESTRARSLVRVAHSCRLEVGAGLQSAGGLYSGGNEGEGWGWDLCRIQTVGPAAGSHDLARRRCGEGERTRWPRITPLAVGVASRSRRISFCHLSLNVDVQKLRGVARENCLLSRSPPAQHSDARFSAHKHE